MTAVSSSAPADERYVLTLTCAEAPGIVHAVSGYLMAHAGDIVESRQYDDNENGRFFMRVCFRTSGAPEQDAAATLEVLRDDFGAVADSYGMQWAIRPEGRRTRVLVMVSRFDHCLNDLLYRARIGDLPIEIVAVVSNHTDHAGIVGWHSIPFFHVPVTAATKPEAERRLLEIVDRFDAELVVLARYMQVLSDELSAALSGRCINIHHSFLPSFKGAKPYHQAHARGVKMIGATAHYVNEELDEGPIIAQAVAPVDHALTPDDLVKLGRDTECQALSEAVRRHCEHRVFLDGGRTVVLR